MSRTACFLAGSLASAALAVLVAGFLAWKEPHGRVSYNGDGVELTSVREKVPLWIDQQGKSLPYGVYHMQLRSGRTLVIHKNNRGNATVTERAGLVLVRTDENVIDVVLKD